MPATLTPQTFVAKWRPIELHERAMAQEHFIDLCRLLDHPTPAEADPSRTWYTFEAGATKATGGQGYADVWKRDFFAWEYKGGHADLDRAYGQLLLYSGALGNPPLLIVSDGQRFRIHTHFTHTVRVTYELTLDDLLQPAKLDLLRKAFTDPEALRSPVTTAQVTEQAATHFARIAQILRRYDHPAPAVAHFLIRLLFCLFAEDIGILPPDLFSRLVTRPGQNATTFMLQVRLLKIRNVGVAVFLFLMRFLPAVILGPFIPIFLQEVMGFPAAIVGFAVLPSTLAMVLLAGVGGKLLDRRGPRAFRCR